MAKFVVYNTSIGQQLLLQRGVKLLEQIVGCQESAKMPLRLAAYH